MLFFIIIIIPIFLKGRFRYNITLHTTDKSTKIVTQLLSSLFEDFKKAWFLTCFITKGYTYGKNCRHH